MEKVCLFVDPFHDYAARFMDLVQERFGYRPVCVLTRRPAPWQRRAHPQLKSLTQIEAAPHRLEAVARDLGARLEAVGAIPFSEEVLGPVLALLRGLGSTWNHSGVSDLLQDKHALKERLRQTHPELAVGISHWVALGEGGLRLPDLPERFVVKPNRSYGNRWVGFFDSRTPLGTIEAFMRASGQPEFVFEEYFEGPEYFVNGQVDAGGQVTTVAVFGYRRAVANGRQVDWLTTKVPHHSPQFAVLDAYARALVSAVGLRRSPFHLEVRLVEGQPRLIELGARLAGNGNAFICNRLHGGRLDVFALAADHYLHESGLAAEPDWKAYDAEDLLYVHGVSFQAGLIHRLEGIEAIEGHPMFLEWVKKPAVGQRLYPTVDMFSSPWCLVLGSQLGPAALEAAAEEIRAELRINRAISPLRRAGVHVADFQRRAGGRLEAIVSRWTA